MQWIVIFFAFFSWLPSFFDNNIYFMSLYAGKATLIRPLRIGQLIILYILAIIQVIIIIIIINVWNVMILHRKNDCRDCAMLISWRIDRPPCLFVNKSGWLLIDYNLIYWDGIELNAVLDGIICIWFVAFNISTTTPNYKHRSCIPHSLSCDWHLMSSANKPIRRGTFHFRWICIIGKLIL